MKKAKKLLRTLIVLVLVFCSLSIGMTVGATNKKSDVKAFKYVSIGGKKLPLKKDAEYWDEWNVKSKKVKIKVAVNKGWKLKKIRYYNADTGKTTTVKNGKSIKTTYDPDSYLVITATKSGKTAKLEIYINRY